jgi:N-acetylmuramoyl-L-alanine amidase
MAKGIDKMIVIIKKQNIVLMGLVFLLMVTIFSLNIGASDDAEPVSKSPSENSVGGQKTVIIDAGHGGEDPGAVSDYSGLKEKDVNLNIALKVKELLEQESFKVIMTRKEDKLEYSPETTNIIQKRKQDLLRRKKIMDEAGADIVVSIHLNKFPQTQYSGAQTFYPPGSQESQKLAQSIQKVIKENVDPANKRESLVKKDPIIILKDYKTTTAIVECGFLSNADEEKKLALKEYQEKLAHAIKEGIVNYFNN